MNKWNISGGLEHSFFPYIGNVIIPTGELIFFRRVGQPPTSINTNQFLEIGDNCRIVMDYLMVC
jgi:hypothetical protein